MKIIRKSNFRVVVIPVEPSIWSNQNAIEQRNHARCEEIAEQIKRHCDYVGSVSVECDRDELCSHCGRRWELSEDDLDPNYPRGTPVCCEAAAMEYRHSTPKQEAAK